MSAELTNEEEVVGYLLSYIKDKGQMIMPYSQFYKIWNELNFSNVKKIRPIKFSKILTDLLVIEENSLLEMIYDTLNLPERKYYGRVKYTIQVHKNSVIIKSLFGSKELENSAQINNDNFTLTPAKEDKTGVFQWLEEIGKKYINYISSHQVKVSLRAWLLYKPVPQLHSMGGMYYFDKSLQEELANMVALLDLCNIKYILIKLRREDVLINRRMLLRSYLTLFKTQLRNLIAHTLTRYNSIARIGRIKKLYQQMLPYIIVYGKSEDTITLLNIANAAIAEINYKTGREPYIEQITGEPNAQSRIHQKGHNKANN